MFGPVHGGAQRREIPRKSLSIDVGACDEEALRKAIEAHFGVKCSDLVEIGHGSFHRIYQTKLDIQDTSSCDMPSEVIARVAFPVFPCDKIESEVATLKLLSEKTSVPVPRVYFWCSDASNPVGAEYIIMSKIAGVAANKAWPNFDFATKANFMTRLGRHMSEIFALRFKEIGSLYINSENPEIVEIGPVVCTTLFGDPQGEEGRPNVRNAERGPFPSAGQWLASLPKHELAFMEQHPDFALSESLDCSEMDTLQDFERARQALQKLSELVLTYCGPLGHLTNNYSLHHHDFRLSNVHVNPSTGDIEALLDWEATHTAPLWACARMPPWIMDETEAGVSYVHDREERSRLRSIFLDEISSEWREAFEEGKEWRIFQNICEFNWIAWGQERMLAKLEAWKVQAEKFPGVPAHEGECQEGDDVLSGFSSSDDTPLVLSPASLLSP